ncbi:MAG: hypothetical protein ICV83_24500 [Cytophagales bacterium]|nr:hypothetical protein [Cytophagales bacterium]
MAKAPKKQAFLPNPAGEKPRKQSKSSTVAKTSTWAARGNNSKIDSRYIAKSPQFVVNGRSERAFSGLEKADAIKQSPKQQYSQIERVTTANELAPKMNDYFGQYEEAIRAVLRINEHQPDTLEYVVCLFNPFDLETENALHGFADELAWDYGDVVKIRLQFVPQESFSRFAMIN